MMRFSHHGGPNFGLLQEGKKKILPPLLGLTEKRTQTSHVDPQVCSSKRLCISKGPFGMIASSHSIDIRDQMISGLNIVSPTRT
jgi:hypothetical protein